MIDLNYFKKVQGSFFADSERSVRLREVKENIADAMVDSIGFYADAKRNDTIQPVVLQLSDSFYKSSIVAMPDDDLCVGDVIDVNGQYWIMTNVRQSNPVQKSGLAWLCNHKFKWQDKNGVVQERYGVLDSGVYSETVTGNYKVSTSSKQYKIYIPYDDATKQLYVDKRIAIAQRTDSHGENVLDVQRITAYDPISYSYGEGAHLLLMFVESDQYNATSDNYELMLCDYFTAPSPTSDITGSDTIRIGLSEQYSVVGTTVVWSITAKSGITYVASGNTVTISVPNDVLYVGEQITVSATADGASSPITKNVEVVAVG